MKSNYLLKICVLAAAVLAAGCGGKSDITGEIVPIRQVCSYEKWKPLAVEGFIAPDTMRCKRVAGKRNVGLAGCTFTVYENENRTGAGVPVYIMTSGWMDAKNNRIESPDASAKNLRIYDNDGNPLAPNAKIRVYGTLPNSNVCELSLAQRIEKVS